VRLLKINRENFRQAVAKAVQVLKNGGIIAHPTDTVWGLACDAGNEQAIRKIHAFKKSDHGKPLLLNLPSKSYLDKIGSKLCKAHKLVKEFWPGGLSLLITAKEKFHLASLYKSRELIGVRLPDHKLSNALARKFGSPLTTTSANLTGTRVAKNADEVAKIFPKVDLILDDGTSSKNNPSTLIDVSGSEMKLIREGSIPFEKITKFLI
jgi:L-threonylcarbamoyladenylate synthase